MLPAVVGSPSSMERGPAQATMDERDMEVIRGMVQALAGYTFATSKLIVQHLTGVLWTQREAEQICPENVKRLASADENLNHNEK